MIGALRRAVLGVLAFGVSALWLPGLGAQEPAPAGPPQDTTELVFEREVFGYPVANRRNPFVAVTEDDAGGPRFEELVLLGVIYTPDPEQSLALIATGVRFNEDGTLELAEGQGGANVASDAEASEDDQTQQSDTTQQAAGGGGAQASQGAPSIPTTGYETYRLRRGEQIGNTRIVEIQRMRVIVEVEEFGITETRELRLRTPVDQGGGQP